MENRVICFPGERPETWIFIYNKFRFYRDKTKTGGEAIRLRCAYRRYGCKVVIWEFPDGTVKVNGKIHQHAEDVEAMQRDALTTEMNEAIRAGGQLQDITNQLAEKHGSAVASQTSALAANSFIQRRRHEIDRPLVPESLEDLAQILHTNDEMKQIVGNNYKGAVEATDEGEGYALIFASDIMLAELNSAKVIEFDGTMKAIPKKPEGTQMWIISFRKSNQAFAAVYAYTRGARAPLYEAILKRVLQLAPGLKKVELIVSDFEKAPRKACKALFPVAKLQGCLFHLVKAISEYWSDKLKLGKLRAPREAKFLSRSLGLLPPHLLEVGIDVLQEITEPHTQSFPELLRFIAYLRKQWLWDPEWTSVFGSAIRTNNKSEAYNRHYTPRVGGPRVTIFILIRNLQDVIEDETIKLQRLDKHLPITKTKREKDMYNRDILILEAQKKLLAQEDPENCSSSTIPKEAVHTFLKECLPAELQEKIDEEHTRVFPRSGETPKNGDPGIDNSDVPLSQDEDEEYGVKKTCKRTSK